MGTKRSPHLGQGEIKSMPNYIPKWHISLVIWKLLGGDIKLFIPFSCDLVQLSRSCSQSSYDEWLLWFIFLNLRQYSSKIYIDPNLRNDLKESYSSTILIYFYLTWAKLDLQIFNLKALKWPIYLAYCRCARHSWDAQIDCSTQMPKKILYESQYESP